MVDDQAKYAFQLAVEQLKVLGAEITEIDFSAFEQLAAQLYQGSWVAENDSGGCRVVGAAA